MKKYTIKKEIFNFMRESGLILVKMPFNLYLVKKYADNNKKGLPELWKIKVN